MTNQPPPPLTCLRCNADLLPGDNRCPRCGWVNHYRSELPGRAYQQIEQWQPTVVEPAALIEGIGDDEHPGPFARLYSWLLAPRHRPFTLAAVIVLALIAVSGYYLAQGGSKPYPGIIIAFASPTPASAPFQPVPFTDPATPTPSPPTPTPLIAHYQVDPTTLRASHILTVTTDAGNIQFVLFYDAAPATVQRLTTAIDQEQLTATEVRRDPDFALTYLAVSASSNAVSFERNNLPLTGGALVEDPGMKWDDYAPISLAVVNDPAQAQAAQPLIVYGRMVRGLGIPSAMHQVKDISYVICSANDQHSAASPCSLTYRSGPSQISVNLDQLTSGHNSASQQWVYNQSTIHLLTGGHHGLARLLGCAICPLSWRVPQTYR